MATRGEMKDHILDGDRRILHCPNCGGEWSGNAGDYWDLPNDYIFHCVDCGVGLELVNKVVTVKYVS